jgi:hypothetical protein
MKINLFKKLSFKKKFVLWINFKNTIDGSTFLSRQINIFLLFCITFIPSGYMTMWRDLEKINEFTSEHPFLLVIFVLIQFISFLTFSIMSLSNYTKRFKSVSGINSNLISILILSIITFLSVNLFPYIMLIFSVTLVVLNKRNIDLEHKG